MRFVRNVIAVQVMLVMNGILNIRMVVGISSMMQVVFHVNVHLIQKGVITLHVRLHMLGIIILLAPKHARLQLKMYFNVIVDIQVTDTSIFSHSSVFFMYDNEFNLNSIRFYSQRKRLYR